MLTGAIGLQILARRLSVELGEQQFSKFPKIADEELTFKEIKLIAREHGLICRAIKSNLDGVDQATKKQPILAYLKNNRYIIVLSVDEEEGGTKTVSFIDPKTASPKLEKIGAKDFIENWTGNGLIFMKSKSLEQKTNALNFRTIFDSFLEEKWASIQLLIILFFINIFGLAPIIFMIVVLDKVVNYQGFSTLYVLTSGVLLAHLFNFILSYFKSNIINLSAAKIEAKYGTQIFSKMVNLPTSVFYQQRSNFSSFSQTLNSIRTTITHRFLGSLNDLVSVLIFTPILIFYSPLLGAIVIGFCILNVLVKAVHDRRSEETKSKFSESSSKRQQILASAGASFVDIKRLGLEKDIADEWRQIEGEYLRLNERSTARDTFISEFGNFLNNVLTVLVLFVGVHLVFEGSLSAGVLIGINMLVGKIYRPTQSLVNFPKEIRIFNKVIEPLSNIENFSQEKTNSGNFHDIIGSVKFQNVEYLDENDNKILSDINFNIDVHDTFGVYSASNSVSSALVQMIIALEHAKSGSILIDGNDINTFNLSHLRSKIAYVDQTCHFFDGTIRENLQRVLPNANNDRISWACKMADLDTDLNRFNANYDTDISDLEDIWDNQTRIKLNLARAVMRNPKIIILDNIFNEMSTDCLISFRNNFANFSKGRTVIAVSKEISHLNICRKLIVIEGNKITQSGFTREIFETEGPAKALIEKQLQILQHVNS